jgi:asparagine synthase (glutamine-hydrolysing)
MCGICGVVTLGIQDLTNNELNISSKLNSAVELLNFRGPDENNIIVKPNFAFGHTRLSIIDVANGQQPMEDETQTTTITYNGEIYNFTDIKETLQEKSCKFKTNSDTEVLLNSYIKSGKECLNELNGIFAFAIFDENLKELFLVRDRLGVKPLYYCYNDNFFYFASTIPALLKISGITKEPNTTAISHYLTTGKITFGNQTLLKDIYTLLPGEYLTVNNNKIETKQYWDIPIIAEESKSQDKAEFINRTKELVEDAIKKQLISDVPLGGFITGGLDSAIITTIANKYTNFELPLFCAGSEYEYLNEFNYAEMVTNRLDASLEKVVVTHSKFFKDWDLLIKNKGLPLSTPNEVSIYHLAKQLSKKCKVTLTGEGADEIFGGYIQPHYSAYDFDRLPNDENDPEAESLFACIMMLESGRNYFINETDHYTSTQCWMPYSDKARLFKEDIWLSIDEDEEVFAFYEDFFEEREDCSTFSKYLHLHSKFNLESLLNRVDNSTMSASIEARVPFTDHRIVELLFSAPDNFKMNFKNQEFADKGKTMTAKQLDDKEYLISKILLRESFSNEIPKDIIERKKMSFPVPFMEWIFDILLEDITRTIINSEFIKEMFEFEVIKEMILTKNRNIWLIANLAKWWEVVKEI